jgi:hypothetical protein
MAIKIAAAPLMVSDAVERDFEIAQRVDRHADPADFADRFRRVGIVAALRRQIEGDVESGLAVGDQIFETLVGVGRIGEAGILPHGERPLPVHQRMDAAGERRLAGAAGIDAASGDHILGGIERFYLDTGFVDHAADGSFLARRIRGFGRFIRHFTFSRMNETMSAVRLPVGNTPRKPSWRSTMRSSSGILPPTIQSLS